LQKSPRKETISAKETYNLIDPTDHGHPIPPLCQRACQGLEYYRLFSRALLQNRLIIRHITTLCQRDCQGLEYFSGLVGVFVVVSESVCSHRGHMWGGYDS